MSAWPSLVPLVATCVPLTFAAAAAAARPGEPLRRHVGVFEGNGGDLRIGLPLQSLHDGRRWVHTPVRLSVFIEAPRAAIERILAKHAPVRRLVDNEWLYLFQLDATERAVHARRGGDWVELTERDAPDRRGGPETTR